MSVATQADAASLTLAWDPPTDTATIGYRVFYGTAPGVYTAQLDVGFVTQRRVDGLADGVTYYFAVRAYDRSRRLSAPSATVSGRTRSSGGAPAGGPAAYSRWPGGTTGDVSAVIRENRYIDIAWTPAPAAADGYRVEVGASFGDADYSALTRDRAITFDMTDLPGAAYFARIRPMLGAAAGYASAELVLSPNSPIVSEAPGNASGAADPCVALPQAPRQFIATAEGSSVSIGWHPGPGSPAAEYVLQAGSGPDIPHAEVAQFPATVTSVTATAPPAAYALRLTGVNACGPSLWAPEARLSVGVEPLPGMPQALSQDVSDGVVTLIWQPPATGGPVTRYLIEALTPAGPWVYDTGAPATVYSNANTARGLYVVTVRAGNTTGFGPATSPMLLSVP